MNISPDRFYVYKQGKCSPIVYAECSDSAMEVKRRKSSRNAFKYGRKVQNTQAHGFPTNDSIYLEIRSGKLSTKKGVFC